MGRELRARDAWAAGASAAVILAVALACAPPPQSGVVTNPGTSSGSQSNYGCRPDQETAREGCVAAEYDEFRQHTVLTYRAPAGPVEVRVLSIPDHVENDGSQAVTLDSYSSNGWEYLECHTVDLLVDGRPFPIEGRVEHRGTVLRGASVAEHTEFRLTRDQLARVAVARTFRGRICRDVFELSGAQLLTLRRYVARYDQIAARDGGAAPLNAPSADASAPADGGDAGDGGAWWR